MLLRGGELFVFLRACVEKWGEVFLRAFFSLVAAAETKKRRHFLREEPSRRRRRHSHARAHTRSVTRYSKRDKSYSVVKKKNSHGGERGDYHHQ